MRLSGVLLLVSSMAGAIGIGSAADRPGLASNLGDPASPSTRPAASAVPYPEGYRRWAHVKSTVIGPTHKTFATNGGFQHVYANAPATEGYRTRVFPEGSIIVFDWLMMQDSAGAFREGARRQIDVMMKDSSRFATTGGWGFQRFVKDSKTELAASPTPDQCFACHNRLKKDGLVLGSDRL